MTKNNDDMTKKAAVKKNYTAPALEKGLDILELLAGEPSGLTLSDIAGRLSRSVSEIFRMLAVLQRREYIYLPKGADSYHLTMKLFEIAHRISLLEKLTAAAQPVMQSVAREVEQSCHMVAYYRGKAMVIAQFDSPADKGFAVRLGADGDLVDTCSGHLLLAYASLGLRKTMIDERKRYRGGKALSKNLLARLEQIRTQGYESLASLQVNGITDVSYPVFTHTGEIAAALTMPFLEHIDGSHSVDFDDASRILGEASVTISRTLGYTYAE